MNAVLRWKYFDLCLQIAGGATPVFYLLYVISFSEVARPLAAASIN